MKAAPTVAPAIVLFDGVCHFCERSVRFIIDRDPGAYFRFAPLQSARGRELLARHGLAVDRLDSMVLIEGGRSYVDSTAALRVARRLSSWWCRLLWGLIVVPRPLRDWAYAAFARRRYRWFGRLDHCPVPPPEVRDRFEV